ncbi:MAG: glycosyltransferase [Defluviitaleaceae bacterium]|nr:glycosyltransferase [Defluviitaleaceae bacterium]
MKIEKIARGKIKISTILPCYNSAHLIDRCLESILKQTLKEIEIICIDDGSTDNTLEILGEYAKKDPRITVLSQENQYAGVARNKGMSIAKGKYLYFMDSDDFLEETALEKIFNRIDELESDICIFGAGTLDLVTDELHYTYPLKKKVIDKGTFSPREVFSAIMTICHTAPWNKVYKKSFLDESKIKFQETQRSNDLYFCQATLIEAETITSVNEWLYTRTINSETSLVETMDINPYSFYDSNKKLREYLVKKGVIEELRPQLLRIHLYSARHVLSKLKTNEVFKDVILFLKEKYFLELEIWQNRDLLDLKLTVVQCMFFIMESTEEEIKEARFNHKLGLLESKVKVSVIIPCYNSERFLHECLDSLLNQTLKEIEIICIDDGSTDGTLEILKSYVEKDRRFKYLAQKNQYAGVARNKGLGIARGKYLSFLDSDDFFEPTMLEKMYKKSEEDASEICIAGGGNYDMRTGMVSYKYKVRHKSFPSNMPFSYKDVLQDIFSISTIAPWNKMYKRSFIQKNSLKYQAIQRANDVYFSQSAISIAERITVVDGWLFTYRIGSETSLIETMDNNPFSFYEANKALKTHLMKRDCFSDMHRSLKKVVLSNAIHTLNAAKTKEAWLKIALFLKSKCIPEFELLETFEFLPVNDPNIKMLKFLVDTSVEELGVYNPILRKDEAESEYVPERNFRLNSELKISVIIPVYNSEKYIEETLRSVLNQSLLDIEIICINDGSTDDSLEILNKLSQEEDRITIISQENRGQSSARNKGLNLAKGEYVMFVDSDDLLLPTSLERLYRKAKYYNLDDLFCEGEVFFDPIQLYEKNEPCLGMYSYNQDYPLASGRKILQQMIKSKQFRSSVCTRLFKRKFLEENMLRFTGGPIYEEKIFTINSLNVARRVMVHREPLYLIRVHSDALTMIADDFNQFYSLGHCLNEALKRAANNMHCEFKEAFLKLSRDYKEDMSKKIKLIRNNNPIISNKMLEVIDKFIVDKELGTYFQNLYVFYILYSFKNEKSFESKENFGKRIFLLRNALQHINDQRLNEAAKKTDFSFHSILNFKQTGEIKPKHLIYKDVLNEDKNDIYAINSQGEVIEKLSQAKIEIIVFKAFNNQIKILGKLDTFFDFSQYNVYFENEQGIKIDIPLATRSYDKVKALGMLINSPFSFSNVCYLPYDFLSQEVHLVAEHQELKTKVNLNLNFVRNSARLMNDVSGSHLSVGNKVIYYEKETKALKVTNDPNKINYLRQLANAQLSEESSKKWDIVEVRNLHPYILEEYKGKQVNLFMNDVNEVEEDTVKLIEYFEAQKIKNEENYFILDEKSEMFAELKSRGIKVIPYRSFEHLKLLLIADKLITTNFKPDIENPFKIYFGKSLRDLYRFKTIVLQYEELEEKALTLMKKKTKEVDLFVGLKYKDNPEKSYEYIQKI